MINDEYVEDRLREALRLHAAEAPPGGTMLTGVAAESARRGRRGRLATLSAGAAALVAIGAAVPFALRAGPDAAPAPAVADQQPAASAPVPAAALVPAAVPTSVIFPYSPPAGAGYGLPMVMLSAGRPTLVQQLPAGAGPATLTLYDARPPVPTSKATAAPATVHGQPAILYSWRWSDDDPLNPDSGTRNTLVWQPASTAWLSLTVQAGSRADLTGYAERIRPGAIEAQAPFTFGLMPAGWTVDNISAAVVTFCPPGVRPDPTFVNKIAVQLDESPGTKPKYSAGSARSVQVGTRTGWLVTSSEGQVLQVPADGGRSLLLQIGPEALLPLDALLPFAASIGVTTAAQVSHG
ncbi:hypothetical protein [Dactylosporangium sp. NPDC051484]|uniref:hypothetical protein n=1 Tax=Dactylosporangium sp. NPDC051484 TaxID=3154942 RepID=UPI00344B2B8B